MENKRLEAKVFEELNNYFVYDKIDIKGYDRYKAGIFYISKDGLHFEDWDYLDNKDQRPEADDY